MIEGQINIFDALYPKFKINKTIRLIELFGGYGSQALALKYLGADFEHWKLCEWSIKSIQAYKDIHFFNKNIDYTKELSIEDIKEYLYKKGLSSNYNNPMTKKQIDRLSDRQARNIYNNIKITNNLVNIQQVKGEDLEILDTDKFCYIMTYSFPCQDLSLAGKGKGMSDTTTRSGLLWEVERVLSECRELPQILLMENVPQIHNEENLPDFNKWKLRLEELGYKNYFKDLLATDYGIPQIRNRCFMISILGDYNYTFPKPLPLTKKLKDLLEDNPGKKYYISDELLKHIKKTKEEHEEYTQYDRYNGEIEMWCRVWKDKSPTLNTRCSNTKIYIKNPTKISDLRIRKLTPKECFRLMGVKDEDYEKVKTNQTESSLYHLAGDSIVVNVLMEIFKEMIGSDGK